MSKLKQSAISLTTYENVFKCPICATPMRVENLQSLICQNKHTFDIAKQGYINMLMGQAQTNYNKLLFTARREIIINNGFFDMLADKISRIIQEQTDGKDELLLVDMGTGEGSLLNTVCNAKTNQSVTGFGLDISKAGIVEATKNTGTNNLWIVADLTQPPFQSGTFDVLLNVLAPSNYKTFNQLLAEDGIAIKVVPRRDYLRELRVFFHDKSNEQDYSNEKVIRNFREQFQVENTYTIQYKKTLDQAALRSLIQMTPLTWHASEDKIAEFLIAGITDITVDLEVLVGRKL